MLIIFHLNVHILYVYTNISMILYINVFNKYSLLDVTSVSKREIEKVESLKCNKHKICAEVAWVEQRQTYLR